MTIFKCYYHYRRHSHTLINYTEYPFHEPNSSAYQSLVKRCRQSFKTTGCCYLPNFISNKTLETILNEITEWLNKYGDRVFHSYELHNLHLQETTNTDEEQQKSSKTVIAYDQIPTTSLLHQIYQYNPLTEFIRQITTPETKLYRSRDEMGAMYVNIYEKGNQLNWHYDNSHFFVNLLLKQPSDEGIFEYKIQNDKIISRNDFEARGLTIFHGSQYRHRVTEIKSPKKERINAIFTYATISDHKLNDYIHKKFFGRIQKWDINDEY